jgi:aspartate ammonia-lyase
VFSADPTQHHLDDLNVEDTLRAAMLGSTITNVYNAGDELRLSYARPDGGLRTLIIPKVVPTISVAPATVDVTAAVNFGSIVS